MKKRAGRELWGCGGFFSGRWVRGAKGGNETKVRARRNRKLPSTLLPVRSTRRVVCFRLPCRAATTYLVQMTCTADTRAKINAVIPGRKHKMHGRLRQESGVFTRRDALINACLAPFDGPFQLTGVSQNTKFYLILPFLTSVRHIPCFLESRVDFDSEAEIKTRGARCGNLEMNLPAPSTAHPLVFLVY